MYNAVDIIHMQLVDASIYNKQPYLVAQENQSANNIIFYLSVKKYIIQLKN